MSTKDQTPEKEGALTLLTKEEIRTYKDLEIRPFPVKAWGGRAVLLQEMSASSRDDFEQDCANRRTGKGPNAKVRSKGMKLKLVLLCVVNEDGSPMFDQSDLPWLNKKSGVAVNEIYLEILKRNGIGAEQLKEMAKNLLDDQSE